MQEMWAVECVFQKQSTSNKKYYKYPADPAAKCPDSELVLILGEEGKSLIETLN